MNLVNRQKRYGIAVGKNYIAHIILHNFRERRKEKEREDLWKRLDQLQLTQPANSMNQSNKGKKR